MTGDPTSEPGAVSAPAAVGEHSRPRRRGVLLLALALMACALGLGVYEGIRARATADATLKQATAEAAVPVVNVVSPTPGAPALEIRLPGTIQAFTDAPIFARTSGYLKRWYFDIGAHVKQGQLLAEIETPEVDQQLERGSVCRRSSWSTISS